MERVRTYVPFVSTPKAKKTSIDDWGLSLNRTHELLNERVVQISKSCGGPFCEFCVDVCLLNDGQLILLIVLRSFASLHCHRSMLIRSLRLPHTKAGLRLEVQSPLIIRQDN